MKVLTKCVGSCFAMVVFTCCAWGNVATDVIVSTDRPTAAPTITSPTFSTASGNELLLAFVSSEANSAGVTVTGVTGAGQTWVLVQRTNKQLGTAEIWRTFASSIISGVNVKATLSQSVAASLTIVTFTGVDTSGVNGSGAIGGSNGASASSGAPTVSVTTTHNGSIVFGVGNDWDRAIARSPGSSQSLVHQYLSSGGDTYWVQQQNSSIALSGTQVLINDIAPTTDRYNLSVVEIIAGGSSGVLSSISGTLSPASLVSGATITLTLPAGGTSTVTPDASGNYIVPNLSNGSYIVTPNKTGQSFSPSSQTIALAGASISSVNFSLETWKIVGTIAPSTAISSTAVTLGGSVSASIQPDISGNYTFSALPNGIYTVTPNSAALVFSPLSQSVTVTGADVKGMTLLVQLCRTSRFRAM